MSSGYDIRWGVLKDSKDMLYEQWRMCCDVEFRRADVENRAPLPIPAPTSDDITKLAEKLYSFVKKKD
jgi:hypothetical protein